MPYKHCRNEKSGYRAENPVNHSSVGIVRKRFCNDLKFILVNHIRAPNSQVNRKQSDSRAVVNIKPPRARDMLRSNVPIARRRTEEERTGLRNSPRRSCLMEVAKGVVAQCGFSGCMIRTMASPWTGIRVVE
jgi:hypothetical protein